jgi:hypothetical protein
MNPFRYFSTAHVGYLSSAFLIAVPAASAAQINGMQVNFIKGNCQQLFLGKEQFASRCSDKLMSTAYPNRRVGFHFVLDDGRGLSFSGMDGENPSSETDIVNIDKVIVNAKGGTDGAVDYQATGTCIYGNPYDGPMTVTCQGKTKDGRKFSGIFTSDGSAPE